MNRIRLIAPLLVFFLAGLAVAQSDTAPDAAEWERRLRAAQDGSPEIDQAVQALRAIGTGLPEDPQTRTALFALADYGSSQPQHSRSTLEALTAATSLYPEDPRTPELLHRLALLHLDARDPYGAHPAFRRIIESGHAQDDPILRAQAAANAAAAGDMDAAYRWSLDLVAEELDGEDRVNLAFARLKSGQALRRYDPALAATRWLLAENPERLHVDAQALLAAGRTLEDVGLWQEAVPLYDVFVNVHPRHPDRPRVLLDLGRLQARTGALGRSQRTLDWLLETYPDSPEAHMARNELLELDGASPHPDQIQGYLRVMRSAPDVSRAKDTCERLLGRFIGAGFPLEVAEALADLAAERDQGMAPLAARLCLEEGLDQILGLLASREDHVSVVAVAVEADQLELRIPPSRRWIVAESRQRLGLPPVARGPLEQSISVARALMKNEVWADAAAELERALLLMPDAHPHSAIEARMALAEALWRLDRNLDALERLRKAQTLAPPPRQARALRVLLADVLFSMGSIDEACSEYGLAAENGASRWVSMQLERCAAPPEAKT